MNATQNRDMKYNRQDAIICCVLHTLMYNTYQEYNIHVTSTIFHKKKKSNVPFVVKNRENMSRNSTYKILNNMTIKERSH